MIAETLRGRGWSVGEINGDRSGEANEETRTAFQTGRLDAVVFTVTESISLHRGELPGGDRDRSLVVHDMRHSAIQLRSEEHTSELQSLMRISYAVFCLKKKKTNKPNTDKSNNYTG